MNIPFCYLCLQSGIRYKYWNLFDHIFSHIICISYLIQWQDTIGTDNACVLVCPSDDGLCAPNTCCGDKDIKPFTTHGVGDSAEANQNNSNDAVDTVNNDGFGELVTVIEGNSNPQANRGQQAVAPFASTHSLDVKFSRDGDEVVLEMSDMAHSDAGDSIRVK